MRSSERVLDKNGSFVFVENAEITNEASEFNKLKETLVSRTAALKDQQFLNKELTLEISKLKGQIDQIRKEVTEANDTLLSFNPDKKRNK